MQLVEQSWNTNVIGNLMWRLQSKLMPSKNLSNWSRKVAGDVFDQVKNWEEKLHYLEEQDLLHVAKSLIKDKLNTLYGCPCKRTH